MKSVRAAAWIAVIALAVALGWVVGLVVITILVPRVISYFLRLRLALAPTTRCPRGHLVEQYGTFRCSCGRITDSWIWQCSSPACRRVSGWTRCPTCGVALDNPMLVR